MRVSFTSFTTWMCIAFSVVFFHSPKTEAGPASRPTTKSKAPTSRPSTSLNSKPKTPAKQKTSPSQSKAKAPVSVISIKLRPKAAKLQTPKKPIKLSKRAARMKKGIHFIRKMLATFLYKNGRDPNNPWLLSHALLAFGKNLTLPSGKKAVDRIVEGFIKIKKINGKITPYFPSGSGRDRIEPHPYMHLKTFLEIGVPLTKTFKVGKQTITLKQMLDGAIRTFPNAPKGKAFGPLAWRMFLLYGRMPQKAWTWNRYDGKSVNFFRIIFKAFKYANHQSNFLRIMQRKGIKKIPKRKQYIYSESCGGFHLLQAVMRWMGHPLLRRHTKSVLKEHIKIIFYRMEGEMNLYLSMFKKHSKNPAYQFVILLQQLKFLGHSIETLSDLHKWGLFTPTKKQRVAIRHNVRMLLITVMIINRMGFFRGVQGLKKNAYQFYLDLLGDSAHALHGLTLIENTTLYH